MPRRDDFSSVLVIGSGPIVIGQGCEFDYSGAQACKSLKDEGFRVVLINSNPATIMTDPVMADRTYVEPITPDTVRKILETEAEAGTPIEVVLPTLGGQTALNCACALHDQGVFEEFGVKMIGADREVIHRAEDRQAFKVVCDSVGVKTPQSRTVTNLDEAHEFLELIGLPAIIRPAFTLGGWGGGIAHNLSEFDELVQRGVRASMIGQVQVDRSLLGWKEYELEVVRDKKDNCVIVCGIENIDAMGVHTGDSVTVAPILTLTDKEYQTLRDAAIEIMRAVGVETGGSNVQFAVDPSPEDGKFSFVCVEMNPRVSRSSALASKATGFPIAKIAAKLAVGYTLDELRNDITRTTSACFEPSIDYVVTKMPRWTFEKFPEADETLTTQMKSVGEAMAIGRTFKESLQKVIRSMDVKRFGLGLDRNDKWLAATSAERGRTRPRTRPPATPAPAGGPSSASGRPTASGSSGRSTRPSCSASSACRARAGCTTSATRSRWAGRPSSSTSRPGSTRSSSTRSPTSSHMKTCSRSTKRWTTCRRTCSSRRSAMGFSDAQLANLYLGTISSDDDPRGAPSPRIARRLPRSSSSVDTCAAEFEAITPYYYSTYEPGLDTKIDDERATSVEVPAGGRDPERGLRSRRSSSSGGGPNRIGQGIEFDYCCVHAALRCAKDLGLRVGDDQFEPRDGERPTTTRADLLFFEPLTLEDTLNVIERLERNRRSTSVTDRAGGVHGRHRPVRRADPPQPRARPQPSRACPSSARSLDSIDLAEDRERFDDDARDSWGCDAPPGRSPTSLEDAKRRRRRAIGYPVLGPALLRAGRAGHGDLPRREGAACTT